jgi:pimeloyl-ACP methyl ester carboxylesterase
MFDVPTRLGSLHVRTLGSGPVAVLWHSLFVDSTSWQRVQDELAGHRRLVLIDGPGHGQSLAVGRRYTVEDCAGAAGDVLDALGVPGPVDWLGSAWGGHVGIPFAAGSPERCRSLVAVSSPVHALSAAERRQITAGRAAYRLLGPVRPLVGTIAAALLGPDPEPAAVDLVRAGFRRANRRGMSEAIRCISLDRPDLGPVLARVQAPTLFVAVEGDPMWTPEQARAAAANLPHATTLVLPGRGHLSPLFDGAAELAAEVTAFWQQVPAPQAP